MQKYLYVIILLALKVTNQFDWPFELKGPLHAQCKVTWTWPKTDCGVPIKALIDQIKKWNGPDNCNPPPAGDGGEKCLYTLKDSSSSMIKATHETPVKHYVDDLTFTVLKNDGTCQIQGFSTSETWYAILDYGTNYCNLNNLITGAGLDKVPGYVEETSDSVCTQHSTANCEVY